MIIISLRQSMELRAISNYFSGGGGESKGVTLVCVGGVPRRPRPTLGRHRASGPRKSELGERLLSGKAARRAAPERSGVEVVGRGRAAKGALRPDCLERRPGRSLAVTSAATCVIAAIQRLSATLLPGVVAALGPRLYGDSKACFLAFFATTGGGHHRGPRRGLGFRPDVGLGLARLPLVAARL